MSRSARKRAKRRDRRRAKQTGWKREGKQTMGPRVGHGPDKGHGRQANSRLTIRGVPDIAPPPKPEKPRPHARLVSLADSMKGS